MTRVFENISINTEMENQFESFVFMDSKYCYDEHEPKTIIPVDRVSMKSKHGNETLTRAFQGIAFS